MAAIVSASVLEDLEDIRAADAALVEHEKDPSGAVTLEHYIRRREGNGDHLLAVISHSQTYPSTPRQRSPSGCSAALSHMYASPLAVRTP